MAMAGGIGQMLFGIVLNMFMMLLFAPRPKDTISFGPRLDSLKPSVKDLQDQIVNLVYGTSRVSGTVFWCSDFRETVHTEVTEYSSKGGGGSYTHTEITYTYDCDIAVGICEGPIIGVKKIWANKELIYNAAALPNMVGWLKYQVFQGTPDQKPPSIMEATIGKGFVSGHKDLAFVMFEQFQLDPFGRRVPQSFEFEVVAKGTLGASAYTYPQISNSFGDKGNSTGYYNIAAPYNTLQRFSILKYTPDIFVVPVWSNDGLKYAIVNIGQKTIDRKYLSNPTAITYVNSSNSISMPGASAYVWIYVTFMGTGVKLIPALVFFTEAVFYTGSTNNTKVAYFINLINGNLLGSVSLANLNGAGSFIYPYWDRIYGNKIHGILNIDGYGNYLSYDVSNLFAGPVDSAENIDNYGFCKGKRDFYLAYNPELGTNPTSTLLYSGGQRKESFIINMVSFPNYIESTYDSSCANNTDPLKEFTIVKRSYKIKEIYFYPADGFNGYNTAKYEQYKNSIVDELEHDKVCLVIMDVTKTIETYKCLNSSQLISTVTTTKPYIYPAVCGTPYPSFDRNPDPPVQGPPYDSNVEIASRIPLFVFYLDDATYGPHESLYMPIVRLWLRFKNGKELINIEHRPTESILKYEMYVKEESDTFIDHKPNKFYNDGDYVFDDFTGNNLPSNVNANGFFVTYNDNHMYVDHSTKFTIVNSNIAIPPTWYWERGSSKIYYTGNTTIYSYDLYDNTAKVHLNTGVTLQNVIPYGGIDFVGVNFTGAIASVYYIKSNIATIKASLGVIVEDISTKAGIDLSILDISDEAYNVSVFGFNISDDLKLISALESLLVHYFIDAFESDWKIKFRTRKENITEDKTTTLNYQELGVKDIGENYNQKYKITTREDTQLPQSVHYAYLSAEEGFTVASVIAMRNINFYGGIKTSIKCPMALTSVEAYSNAFRILFDLWRATKEYEFRLPKKYSYLEPGDLVLLPIGPSNYSNEYSVVKITEVTMESNAYIECLGVDEDARDIEGIINDGAFEEDVNTLVTYGPTLGIMYNSAPLYNKYTNIDYSTPGMYYTFYTPQSNWIGGGLYTSFDDITFALTGNLNKPAAAFGSVIAVTNNTISKYYTDTVNAISIQLTSFDDFYSVSDDDYYCKEGNLIGVYKKGSDSIEYIQYYTISRHVDNPTMLTLSILNRGLYNTNTSNPISIGDTVFLLPDGTNRQLISTEYYNKAIYYKYVTSTQNIDIPLSNTALYTCKWYEPYNVANFKAVKSGSDISLSWFSRERNKPSYLLHSPNIIDAKVYKLEIYDKFNVLIRTVDNITSDSYTYSSVDLTTDGFTIDSFIKFKLKRKATFLEYNHTIEDSAIYVDNTIIALQNISNNKLLVHIESDDLKAITNTPSYGPSNVIYNNYSGNGYITKDKPLYGLSSSRPTLYEQCTFTTTENGTSWSLVAWVYFDGWWESWWNDSISIVETNIYGEPLNTYTHGGFIRATRESNLPKITCADHCGWWGYSEVVPINKWLMVYCSYATGRAAVYIRSLDNTYSFKVYQENIRTCWGSSTLYGTTKILDKDNDLVNIRVQNISMYSSNLYIDSGNNWDIVDGIYNLGVSKWQQQ